MTEALASHSWVEKDGRWTVYRVCERCGMSRRFVQHSRLACPSARPGDLDPSILRAMAERWEDAFTHAETTIADELRAVATAMEEAGEP